MLNIVIVGAGIAGLSTGIALRRAGHTVHIYERSGGNNEVGAAINVPPNASRFLTRWGLDPGRNRFVKARILHYVDPMTMEVVGIHSFVENWERYSGADLYFAHRIDLHESLKSMATDPEGPGAPVTIHFNSCVVRFNPEDPSITLSDGETIHGDVVIAADGVHSVARETVLGQPTTTELASHANCCYRFLIPAAVIEDDPETRFWNVNCDGNARVFPHNATKRRIVSYPCRDNTVHNFIGIFYDEQIKTTGREDWQAGVDKSHVLKEFADYHPNLLAVIGKATEVKKWPLLYRRPIPTWRKGKLALAGDAAHPMLPHQGQGGAQGLEDGVVLGIVLYGTSTPEEIEKRLGLYEKIRRNRASAIQILSNVGQDQTHLVHDELKQFLDEKDIPTTLPETSHFNYKHDAVEAALKVMKEYDPSYVLPPHFFAENGCDASEINNTTSANGTPIKRHVVN